ncbi:hypothetical protein ARMGADRAFT_685197 [Armillaria gallica]|uniref:Uncharacterized protein n=1 Tax=Armillaria gallica TaxID=47427 RepID=A0A2H3CI48_ARMGA|nr:hypothetical protein ARMGADRAFT_685197 [Armillaria gallica]
MHYVKTTSCYSDPPLPTPCPSLSEDRPAGHRPKSLALTTTNKAPDEQERPLQPEFRPYGRGGAGSRRPRVKPNKSELDSKDKPKFSTFKFPAKWRSKVPASEQTSPANSGFYDGPWCGPSSSSQSTPSLLSSSSSRDSSPMITQRDLFLISLWKKNSKKMRADSLSITCSTSSTSSGHSSSASGSSLASLSRPEEGDDSASEMYAESFETPSSAPYSLERVITCPEDSAASESTGLEACLPTTEITVVGMGDECDVLDAMRKLRMK